jgi:predicted HicB family RNase H-like nuclease
MNVRIDAALARELKVEAIQMGMKLEKYVAMLLSRRQALLK